MSSAMRARHDRLELLVPEEMPGQVVSFEVGCLNPGDRQVEAAFAHSCRLGVRGQHPLINSDPKVGDCRDLWWQPAHIAKPQRQLTGSVAGMIQCPRRGVQDLSRIGKELAAGWCQFDVPAVADEELSPELAFEIADLLRQRRSGEVKPLCRPTEVQLLSDSDEVGQLPELHPVDRRADLR